LGRKKVHDLRTEFVEKRSGARGLRDEIDSRRRLKKKKHGGGESDKSDIRRGTREKPPSWGEQVSPTRGGQCFQKRAGIVKENRLMKRKEEDSNLVPVGPKKKV